MHTGLEFLVSFQLSFVRCRKNFLMSESRECIGEIFFNTILRGWEWKYGWYGWEWYESCSRRGWSDRACSRRWLHLNRRQECIQLRWPVSYWCDLSRTQRRRCRRRRAGRTRDHGGCNKTGGAFSPKSLYRK